MSGRRIKTLSLNDHRIFVNYFSMYCHCCISAIFLTALPHCQRRSHPTPPVSPGCLLLPELSYEVRLLQSSVQHNSLPFSQATTGTVQISFETKMLCSNYFASNSDVFSLFWKAADISNCKNIPWFILANYNSKVIKTKLNSISKNNTRVLLLLML